MGASSRGGGGARCPRANPKAEGICVVVVRTGVLVMVEQTLYGSK